MSHKLLIIACSALASAGIYAEGNTATSPQDSDTTGQTASVAQQSDLDDGAKFVVAEEHDTVVLDPPNPHRFYIVDPVFPHLIASKVYAYDGDNGNLLGMMNTGYVPNMVLAKNHNELLFAETYWSRGSRGERVDVLTRYDAETLAPKDEIVLPNGRLLIVTKRHNADISPDGRFFYSFNLAPMTSVSVIDLEAGAYLGEIATPGCAMVLPIDNTSFASICADGSITRYDFNPDNLEAESTKSRVFFDAEYDPVFEHTGLDIADKKLHLITYSGLYYTVDLSGKEITIDEPWQFVDDQARSENWRPGGWQMMAYHADNNRTYVLMHEGEDWTHKAGGDVVWELDPVEQKILRKIALEEEAVSVAVTPDDDPILITLTEEPSATIHNLASEEVVAHIDSLGDSPYIIMVEGN